MEETDKAEREGVQTNGGGRNVTNAADANKV